MGKTGTTSDFRDALFVGSTYGPQGITVAVRIGFDDNRPLGTKETGGRTALPIFREVMLQIYRARVVGPAPNFPPEIEAGIDQYLAAQAVPATTSPTGSPAPGLVPTRLSEPPRPPERRSLVPNSTDTRRRRPYADR
jgi:penicillin-binding protein 1A